VPPEAADGLAGFVEEEDQRSYDKNKVKLEALATS
jgi:hypothetical protein